MCYNVIHDRLYSIIAIAYIPRMYIAVTSLSLFYKYTAAIALTEVERISLNMYYICFVSFALELYSALLVIITDIEYRRIHIHGV